MNRERSGSRVVAGLVLASLCACAVNEPRRSAAPVDRGVATAPAPAPYSSRSRGGLGAAWIPWATLDINERPREPGPPPAKIEDGTGWMARAGLWEDGTAIDVVFTTTEHDEQRTGAELTTGSLYVDFLQTEQLWEGPVAGHVGAGIGLGAIHFDWDRTYDSETTGYWQGEGVFALVFGKHVSIEARIMGFFAAHPTRTVGTGALATLGGSFAF